MTEERSWNSFRVAKLLTSRLPVAPAAQRERKIVDKMFYLWNKLCFDFFLYIFH